MVKVLFYTFLELVEINFAEGNVRENITFEYIFACFVCSLLGSTSGQME